MPERDFTDKLRHGKEMKRNKGTFLRMKNNLL